MAAVLSFLRIPVKIGHRQPRAAGSSISAAE